MEKSQSCQHVTHVFKKMGFVSASKIGDTLQGSIWRASKRSKYSAKGQKAVIKITNRFLHKHSVTFIKGKPHRINENILLEQSILKYLTENEKCPKSIVKFQQFFKTKTDYYLVMQDGGRSLFQFIQNVHKLVLAGKIEVSNWLKVVKIIFKQMIECIDYIHSMNVCHCDISLENFVINDVEIEVQETADSQKIRFLLHDIQIKLCDFGLAQLFTNSQCLSSKYGGKTNYKSPEVLGKKKRFNAKKNDIWCVGVCLFMMTTGNAPWHKASKTDPIFALMMNGYMMDLLKRWGVLRFFSADLIDLFESIFQFEAHRISINGIKKHKWLK